MMNIDHHIIQICQTLLNELTHPSIVGSFCTQLDELLAAASIPMTPLPPSTPLPLSSAFPALSPATASSRALPADGVPPFPSFETPQKSATQPSLDRVIVKEEATIKQEPAWSPVVKKEVETPSFPALPTPVDKEEIERRRKQVRANL